MKIQCVFYYTRIKSYIIFSLILGFIGLVRILGTV